MSLQGCLTAGAWGYGPRDDLARQGIGERLLVTPLFAAADTGVFLACVGSFVALLAVSGLIPNPYSFLAAFVVPPYILDSVYLKAGNRQPEAAREPQGGALPLAPRPVTINGRVRCNGQLCAALDDVTVRVRSVSTNGRLSDRALFRYGLKIDPQFGDQLLLEVVAPDHEAYAAYVDVSWRRLSKNPRLRHDVSLTPTHTTGESPAPAPPPARPKSMSSAAWSAHLERLRHGLGAGVRLGQRQEESHAWTPGKWGWYPDTPAGVSFLTRRGDIEAARLVCVQEIAYGFRNGALVRIFWRLGQADFEEVRFLLSLKPGVESDSSDHREAKTLAWEGKARLELATRGEHFYLMVRPLEDD